MTPPTKLPPDQEHPCHAEPRRQNWIWHQHTSFLALVLPLLTWVWGIHICIYTVIWHLLGTIFPLIRGYGAVIEQRHKGKVQHIHGHAGWEEWEGTASSLCNAANISPNGPVSILFPFLCSCPSVWLKRLLTLRPAPSLFRSVFASLFHNQNTKFCCIKWSLKINTSKTSYSWFFFFHSYWFLCSYSFVFIFLFHYFLILFGFLQLNKYPVFILQVLFFKIPLNLNSLSSNFSPVSYAVVLCFTLCLSALTFFFFLFIFKALQARTISACVKCIIIL